MNIEPNHTTLAGHDFEHDVLYSQSYDILGSIDANSGDYMLGRDTDNFCMDVKKATLVMEAVIKQGGLNGGLNFDCKLRRESTDIDDMFIAHIGAMDVYAQALMNVEQMLKTKEMDVMRDNR